MFPKPRFTPLVKTRYHLKLVFLLGLALIVIAAPGRTQPVDVPVTWGGDLSSRPRLGGDWGGLRDEMGKKGVVFDVDLLVTPMAVLNGGRSTGSETWGNLDYTLNVDTDKLGLWPGGFLKVSGDTGFGTNLNQKAGAIVPVNTATLIPGPNDHTTALMNATFTQFLSPKLGLVIGKFNTLDLGEQEFYGNYSTQFLNTAFAFPMTLEQVPVSAFGGGVIALPTKDINLSLLALDPNGTPTSNDLNSTFNNGVMLTGGAQVTIRPAGLVGDQGLGFSWSNKDRYSLEQDPSNLARLLLQTQFPRLGDPGPVLQQILARFFPGLLIPAEPPKQKSTSWAVNYAFDQYLWQPPGDSMHGIGVFLSAGASDGNPNPIKYAFIAGIGGKGVPGRPNDSFGVGIARTQFSGAFIPFLRQRLNLGLDYEDSVEAYYNLTLTGWLSATADLQIVDPGLKKALNSSGLSLVNVDTATVAGIRLRARF
jgi:porin